MTPQEQLNQISERIIRALSRIKEKPESWLPHIVHVEEESDGYPVYTLYRLKDIRKDGSCSLLNPVTGECFPERWLHEINIDWLLTVWNRYVELCTEQNLSAIQVEPDSPFRVGNFVRLTDEAIRKIDETFGKAAADYRRDLLLQVQSVRQDKENGTWHIGVQDIHEDDAQEFTDNYLRPVTAEEMCAWTKAKSLYAFVWSCNLFGRDVPDEKIIETWENGASRSLNDEEDESLYEVERLTPDELAERINDECFNDTEDYVRFIEMEE